MSITMITGPMFSGKTTELINTIKKFRQDGKKCVIVKHANDNRYDTTGSSIVTHDGYVYQDSPIIQTDQLDETLLKKIDDYQVIGIDEGFMFNNICDFSETLANLGKEVYLATINGSYQQKIFPSIANLISIAEYVIKLSAKCHVCGGDAHYTIRTNKSTDLIVVGGSEVYAAVCRKCLIK